MASIKNKINLNKYQAMKLSKLLFLFMLAIATVSCSSDDDATPYEFNNVNLSGNYKIELLNDRKEQTFTINNATIVSVTEIIGSTFKVNTVFNADGTFTSKGNYFITKTTTTSGQTETTTDIIDVDVSGNYVLNQTARNITISHDGKSTTYDVALYDETKLNLKRDSSEPIDEVPTISSFKMNLVRK